MPFAWKTRSIFIVLRVDLEPSMNCREQLLITVNLSYLNFNYFSFVTINSRIHRNQPVLTGNSGLSQFCFHNYVPSLRARHKVIAFSLQKCTQLHSEYDIYCFPLAYMFNHCFTVVNKFNIISNLQDVQLKYVLK